MATTERLAASIPAMFMTPWNLWNGTTNNDIPDRPSTAPDTHEDTKDENNTPYDPSTPLPTPRPTLQRTPGSALSTTSSSPTKTTYKRSIMFAEPDSRSSDDDLSREGSIMSGHALQGTKRTRSKTSYSICHPPPSKAGKKLHVRTRTFLQLHKLAAPSSSGRPMPAFEILPSAMFSHDVAVVKADRYEEARTEEDGSRDTLAVIKSPRSSVAKCGKTVEATTAINKQLICLDDGREWQAYQLPNGGYEFSSTDVHGLGTTARWIPKRQRVRKGATSPEPGASQTADNEIKKFNFSTITPSSRRHPVIASITRTKLDIQDSYFMPSPVTSAANSPPLSAPAMKRSLSADTIPEEEAVTMTPELHNLIVATGVWVALREGWCPSYKNDDGITRSPSVKATNSPRKTVTSPDLEEHRPELVRRSSSLRRLLQSPSLRKRQRREEVTKSVASTVQSAPAVSSPLGEEDEPVVRRRTRADTTSTVIIHRPSRIGLNRRNTDAPYASPGVGTSATDLADVAETSGILAGETDDEEDEKEGDESQPARQLSVPGVLPGPPDALDGAVERKAPAEEQQSAPELRRRFTEKKRDGSTTTAASSVEYTARKPEVGVEVEKKRKRRRGGVFRVLMCGLVKD